MFLDGEEEEEEGRAAKAVIEMQRSCEPWKQSRHVCRVSNKKFLSSIVAVMSIV